MSYSFDIVDVDVDVDVVDELYAVGGCFIRPIILLGDSIMLLWYTGGNLWCTLFQIRRVERGDYMGR